MNNIQGDNELFEFLTGSPKQFREQECIRKHQLKNGDFIHCVLWNNHFYITGTDIVKILVWRFQNAGRNIASMKKFEEGIFSDLRNLKPGVDASLESPRSEFLEFLYKNGCIRTQKKQKVFFWFSVPHDSLFCDALERDLRRENNSQHYSGYRESKMAMNRKIMKNSNMMNNVSPVNVNPMVSGQMMNSGNPMNNSLMSSSIAMNSNLSPINNNLVTPIHSNFTTQRKVESDMVKKLLFNTDEQKAQRFSQEFNAPFSMRELDNQAGLFNGLDYEMADVLVDPKAGNQSNDDKPAMGKRKETYPMPNIQGGYQK